MTDNSNEQTQNHGQLHDVFFIHLSKETPIGDTQTVFDTNIPLPVQQVDASTFDPTEGVSVAMIAAGLIKIMAYQPNHIHAHYYKDLLFSLQPDILQELQLAGIAKAQNGEESFAEELFLAAVHLNPTLDQLYVNLSVLYGKQAKLAQDSTNEQLFDEAITKQLGILQEGLSHNPLSELLLSEIGLLQLFLGNEEIALEHLRSYLRVATEGEKKELIQKQVDEIAERRDQQTILHEAFDEMQLGNETQALQLITTFITHNPKAWSGYFIKGWAHRKLQQWSEAQEAFLRCLELGERNSDIYNELSICALELGETQLSKDYIEIAVELDPENVKLISNLAYLYMRDDEIHEAYQLVMRGYAIDPEDPAILHLYEKLKPYSDFSKET